MDESQKEGGRVGEYLIIYGVIVVGIVLIIQLTGPLIGINNNSAVAIATASILIAVIILMITTYQRKTDRKILMGQMKKIDTSWKEKDEDLRAQLAKSEDLRAQLAKSEDLRAQLAKNVKKQCEKINGSLQDLKTLNSDR